MKLLLDTNVLIWWTLDDARLGARARTLIMGGDNQLLFSPASPWEIAIKVNAGKLNIDVVGVMESARAAGMEMPPLREPHFVTFGILDRHHGDPFDRMIVAQALVESASLMTADRTLSRYPVRVIGCQ